MFKKLILAVLMVVFVAPVYAADIWLGGKAYDVSDVTVTDGIQYGVTVLSTNALTLTSSHHTIACNHVDGISDITVTLPDASPVGQEYVIHFYVDGGNDVIVDAASGDTFDNTNDRCTFADAEDLFIIQSIAANRWLIINNTGGTLSTQ